MSSTEDHESVASRNASFDHLDTCQFGIASAFLSASASLSSGPPVSAVRVTTSDNLCRPKLKSPKEFFCWPHSTNYKMRRVEV